MKPRFSTWVKFLFGTGLCVSLTHHRAMACDTACNYVSADPVANTNYCGCPTTGNLVCHGGQTAAGCAYEDSCTTTASCDGCTCGAHASLQITTMTYATSNGQTTSPFSGVTYINVVVNTNHEAIGCSSGYGPLAQITPSSYYFTYGTGAGPLAAGTYSHTITCTDANHSQATISGSAIVVAAPVGCTRNADCGGGYCSTLNTPYTCAQYPTSVAFTAPQNGAVAALHQPLTISAAAAGGDIHLVGTVITLNGDNFCYGNGYACSKDYTPTTNQPIQLQATAWIADTDNGLHPTAVSASLTVNGGCTADAQCAANQYCTLAHTCDALPTNVTFSAPNTTALLSAGQALYVSATANTAGDASKVGLDIFDNTGTICQSQTTTCATANSVFFAPNVTPYTVPKTLAGNSLSLTASAYVMDSDPAYDAQNHKRYTVSQTFTRGVCGAGYIVKNGACAAPTTNNPRALGVFHWGSGYRLTGNTKLLEGAQYIQRLGAQSISLALSPSYSEKDYPGEDFGTAPIHSLTDLAKTQAFQQMFNMPFTTFVIVTFPFSDPDYLGPGQDLPAETQEIADLTAYLLTTYQGTGKTFILKNWEGDNALSLQATNGRSYPDLSDPSAYQPPSQTLVNKMVGWLNARHDGVVQGRARASTATNVTVKDAAEISAIMPVKWGKPCMLSAVVPNIHSDMISYSAYDTTNRPSTDQLYKGVQSDVALLRSYINGRPLLIGEYGVSEQRAGVSVWHPDPDIRVETANLAFLDAGAAPVTLWVIEDSTSSPGMALVRDDGSFAPMWTAMRNQIGDLGPPVTPPPPPPAPGAPIADAQTITIAYGQTRPITLTGSDPAHGTLTFKVTQAPTHGALTGTVPYLAYTPSTGFAGTDSFQFVSVNASTESAAATVKIAVGLPDAPTADAQSVTTPFNKPVPITLTATDPNNLPLSYIVTGQPQHGMLQGVGSRITYIPNTIYSGPDRFIFTASNGLSTSTLTTVDITVSSALPPVANSLTVTVAQGTPRLIVLTGSDPNGLPLTYNLMSWPAGELDGAPPTLTYISSAKATSDQFTFTVSNRYATSAPATVTIMAGPPSSAPTQPPFPSFRGGSYTPNDAITVDYSQPATSFIWTFESAPTSSVAGPSPATDVALQVTTPSPSLQLAGLALPIGSYVLDFTAVNGSNSVSWNANIQLKAATAETDLANPVIYPNPWRADGSAADITFKQLPSNSTVKIFTVSGRWVQTLSAPSGQTQWPLTTRGGDKVASGLYIYLITDPTGHKYRGKFTVIR